MVAKENGHEMIVKKLMDNGATLPLEQEFENLDVKKILIYTVIKLGYSI